MPKSRSSLSLDCDCDWDPYGEENDPLYPLFALLEDSRMTLAHSIKILLVSRLERLPFIAASLHSLEELIITIYYESFQARTFSMPSIRVLKINCMDSRSIPHFSALITSFPNIHRLDLYNLSATLDEEFFIDMLAFPPMALTEVSVSILTGLDIGVLDRLLTILPSLRTLQLELIADWAIPELTGWASRALNMKPGLHFILSMTALHPYPSESPIL